MRRFINFSNVLLLAKYEESVKNLAKRNPPFLSQFFLNQSSVWRIFELLNSPKLDPETKKLYPGSPRATMTAEAIIKLTIS